MNLILPGLVDIIVLRFNTPEYDRECIKAIFDNTTYFHYQVTLFDNYPVRFSLSTIWNMLIGRSLGEYICLLNNDTKPDDGWLTKMVEVFEKEERVGAVGPSTNQCHSPQKVARPSQHYEVVDFEKACGKANQLAGFCVLFPKSVWKEVGGFDQGFGFYAQENEFLHRVQKAGYRTLWRKDAYVWHAGEASARKLAEEEGFDIILERYKGNELYQESLQVQTDDNWRQLLLRDDEGRGLHYANGMLAQYKDRVGGKYVYIFDDDNRLLVNDFVAGLRVIVERDQPDVIMVKSRLSRHGIMPRFWEERPQLCQVDTTNFVVERSLWKAHIEAFHQPVYGDFYFIDQVFEQPTIRVVWWDKVVAEDMR